MNAWLPGVLLGTFYWYTEEHSIPTEANCSYMASPLTDLMAFVGGVGCAYEGQRLGSPMIAFFGAAVATIHTFQFIYHKRHGADRSNW